MLELMKKIELHMEAVFRTFGGNREWRFLGLGYLHYLKILALGMSTMYRLAIEGSPYSAFRVQR
jgi:hypothetical protein